MLFDFVGREKIRVVGDSVREGMVGGREAFARFIGQYVGWSVYDRNPGPEGEAAIALGPAPLANFCCDQH